MALEHLDFILCSTEAATNKIEIITKKIKDSKKKKDKSKVSL